MSIRQSQWQQTVEVLKSSHELWGAGLSKSHYIEFLNQQLTHPYGKRNLRFMVYEKDGQVVSSCKLYRLEMKAKSQTVPILGVGAIFTPSAFRGQGHAGQMLEEVIELAESEGHAGLVLYSEIGTDFYEQYDFLDLGETNFVCDLSNANRALQNYLDKAKKRSPAELKLAPLISRNEETLAFLHSHYRRWLGHHSLRFLRSPESWSFKIMKERFLYHHCQLPWPQIKVLQASNACGQASYALVEWAAGKLRVLEAIGSDAAMPSLWLDIVTLAYREGLNYIHGWVGTAPEALGQLYVFDRGWGRPMLLPLNDQIESLLAEGKFSPCPFLELDHL
jgi:predicted GNAT family N-acyltransferase